MKSDVNEIYTKLLNENDWGPIEIINSKGETARFSQIALIPSDSDSNSINSVQHNFAILQPLDNGGNEIDKPIVIDFINQNGELSMKFIDDQYIISDVFEEYHRIQSDNTDESNEWNEITDNSQEVSESDTEELITQNKKEKKGFFRRLFGK